MIETDIIILKTHPFQESSLITQVLSDSYGRISIIAKGARKINKRQFPNIGLYRCLTAQLTAPKSGDLYTLKSAEINQVNDSIAGYPDLIDYATAAGQFSLSSNFNGIPCPLYHHILKECLSNLNDRKLPFSAWTCRLIICHLMEQGLFPEMNLSDKQKYIIENLIEKDHKAVMMLQLNDNQWQSLLNWTLKIAKYAEIELPQSPFFSLVNK